MLTIDAQVHVYERNHAGRPWLNETDGPPEVTGEDMITAMDAVGVDGALLVSQNSRYGFDASYAIAVHQAHPERFALIKPVDPSDPAVSEIISDWASTNGTVGIRLLLMGNVSADPTDVGINRVLTAAAKHSLPVNVMCWDRLDQIAALAARNPNTVLLIDHLGLRQPYRPATPIKPFSDLVRQLSLAVHDNVFIKVSGVGTMSCKPFPFDDLWGPLDRIFEAFGMDRCMWGSDWTRVTAFLTYRQAADLFRKSGRLSDGDRKMLLGVTLHNIYNWLPYGKKVERLQLPERTL